jgi:KDO2-lipid IV(A) lauroyltransferase
MRKRRSRLLDFLVYLCIRVEMCIFQILPPGIAVSCMRLLGRLTYHLDRRHREVARDNLRHAFPGRFNEAELDQLVRQVYDHFALMFLEVVLMPRKLGPYGLRNLDAGDDWAKFQALHDSGRAVLIVTGHFGNWELAGALVGCMKVKAHLIARPLDNPYLERLITSLRERNGHKVLPKNGAARMMREILADGGTLCTLADQDAGPGGLFVDFFGRPASTHKGIAHLALRTNAVVIVGGVKRAGGLLQYSRHVTDIIYPEEYANHHDAVRALTERMTAAVEQFVRLDPCQYFWLHRRWKHQPSPSAVKAA